MHTPFDYRVPVLRNKMERVEPLMFYINRITRYRNYLIDKEGAAVFLNPFYWNVSTVRHSESWFRKVSLFSRCIGFVARINNSIVDVLTMTYKRKLAEG